MDSYKPAQQPTDQHVAEPPDGPFSERGTRILKFAVVFMGILLIVGFMVVVITIGYRAVKLGQNETPGVTTSSDRHGFGRLDVEVEPDTLISQIELDGNRMAVHVTKDAADEILIIDIKTGELIGRVRLLEKFRPNSE